MRYYWVRVIQIFAIAAFYFAAASAVAADPTSPNGDAHLLLKQLFNKGIVAGNSEQDRHFTSYRGYRCHSTFEIRHEVLDIDWNLMTSVTDFAEFAHAHGPVIHTDVNGIKDTGKDAGFWLPNADTARQVADAMRVLMTSCAPKPKSD
jgi:hypothetical protein